MPLCYMCNSESVSYEHVPPLCIFPEKKDLPTGKDLRKNLITVPSCKEHNLRKSRDDEYLLYILVSNWYINDIGLNQWKTKIIRSMQRRPGNLGIFKNLQPASVNGIKTGYFRPDFTRLTNELTNISRGLYYYHFHEKWEYTTNIIFQPAITITGPNPEEVNNANNELTQMISQYLVNSPVFGDNPEVFYYRYKIEEGKPNFVFQMVFYGGVVISVISPT